MTKGSPRKLCELCDNALIAAYLKGLSVADESIIREAAQDIRLQEEHDTNDLEAFENVAGRESQTKETEGGLVVESVEEQTQERGVEEKKDVTPAGYTGL
jgi:hypothetical protein